MLRSQQPGGGKPPMRRLSELAAELGVSTSTLSCLLRHHPQDKPEAFQPKGYGKTYYRRQEFLTWYRSIHATA